MPDYLSRKFATWFGSGKPSVPSRVRNIERRQFDRFQSKVQTSIEPAVGEEPSKNPARVADISQTGVRLLVDQPEEPGTLLHVAVPNCRTPSPEILLACVVHAEPQQKGWSLGCSFIRELSTMELQAFL